jgi:glycosyltransferase involved in cell wall biosynthesis
MTADAPRRRAHSARRPRILYVCHNHPRNRPGGAEIYAYELFCGVRDAGEFEPTFVAKIGPPMSIDTARRDTRFGVAGPGEYFLFTTRDEFDRVLGTARRKRLYTEDWREFLRVQQPDIVHFQHAMFLGYDMIRETRRALPDAKIVYTLHEFMPICQHNGQMVRRETQELCYAASPRRCHQCFPNIAPQTFFLRERFVKSAFALVDMFVTPSRHARQRYIEWGIEPDRIMTENYGRLLVTPGADPPDAGRRRRIGFFGQMTKHKGVDVLLEAMKLLQQAGSGVQLTLCGANLEHMDPRFQKQIRALLAETEESVRFTGRYEQPELPGLLASVDWVIVPSIWWETGPLVIQEAMMHRRPVICSDIGSMVERITDGQNGLLFRVGDPRALADTILRGVDTDGLWDEIRGRITDPHPMAAHLKTMSALYEGLLARTEGPVAA